MKTLLATLCLMLSVSAFADNGTCSQGSVRIYACSDDQGVDYDVCQQGAKGTSVIKVAGEEYATSTQKFILEDSVTYTGLNYDEVKFDLIISDSADVLTEFYPGKGKRFVTSSTLLNCKAQ